MSHNLNEVNGKVSMMFSGETPWHGLGTKLDNPATAKEAIEAANLGYEVELQPIFMQNGNSLGSYRASVRKDTSEALGVVTENYKVIQNIESFDFFDSIVGEGQAIYHTAGALGKGERIWMLAKLPQDTIVTKDDVVENYLLLTNSHDGKSSLKMYFTPVRVVCQNTLNLSYKDAVEGVSIRHIGDIKNKAEEARRILGLAVNYYARFSQDAHALVKYKMNDQELDAYFTYVLSGKRKLEEDDKSTRMKNNINALKDLFVTGKGNDHVDVRGSAWAAYNSVTEYADHHKTIRNLSEDPTKRLDSIWFGSGKHIKTRAFDAVSELVGLKA